MSGGRLRTLARAGLSGSGRPLGPDTRRLMENRFGQSFSDVRVHDHAGAARASSALDAQAYTIGAHIAFGAGRYRPDTPEGRGLLAHELAHSLQQRGETALPGPARDKAAAERQAHAMAGAAARGGAVPAATRYPAGPMLADRSFSLTFDDGPHAARLGSGANRTENVLDALKAQSVRGGFFVQTGVAIRMANRIGRALVARMHAEGHTVGVHTGGTADHESHPKAEAAGRLEGELESGKAAIEKATGMEPTFIRPPFGDFNRAVTATYQRTGLTNLLWDIDGDRDVTSPEGLLKRIDDGVAAVKARNWKTRTASPHIVVLLHDIRLNTSQNVHAVIARIRKAVTRVSDGVDTATFSPP